MKTQKIILLLFIAFVGSSVALVYAAPSEHYISDFSGGRHYYVQETSYNCGPASIQMVLDWLGAQPLPTQVELATELNIPVGGPALINMMSLPFQSRGFEVEARQGLGIDNLKESIASGHPVIILMYIDAGAVYGHYVVVVGYNETGVFVHDPYSQNFGTISREVGANVFISYDSLTTLWSYPPGQWGLIIKSGPTDTGPLEPIIGFAVVVLGIAAVLIILKKRI